MKDRGRVISAVAVRIGWQKHLERGISSTVMKCSYLREEPYTSVRSLRVVSPSRYGIALLIDPSYICHVGGLLKGTY